MLRVRVRGEEYRIVASRDAGASGSRWFGQRVFTLERCADGSRWECLGKRVAWNSRLHPVAVS